MAHIRWTEAYQYFISSDVITYWDVGKKLHISLDYLKEVGARDKWIAKRKQTNKAALNLIDQRTKELIVQRTQSHTTFATALQSEAAKKLAEGKLPTTPHDILTWIETGIKLERQALGMDNKVNKKFYLDTPKTKYHITYGDGAELDEY